MHTVLHITPHLSGGLGRVLLSTLKHANSATSGFKHEIIVFEDLPQKSADLFRDYGDCLHVSSDDGFIRSKVNQADVVQLEWWNHPSVYKFLFLFEFPPSRVVVCCHVSGFARPQIINKNVVEFSDIFLAVTKATKAHPLFQTGSSAPLIGKLRFVTFPVDVDRFEQIQFRPHEGFNIGYVGTVDYAKLHRNFLKMSASAKIPDARFVICGEDIDGKIEAEAKQYDRNNFTFLGYEPNIRSVFETLDVFGYPLNAKHFGSGEQVLLEAMFAGLPVVAFANPAEREIIENNETGILVNSEREYVAAIENLYRSPGERVRLGQNARKHVRNLLLPDRCFRELDGVYQEVLSMPKRPRVYSGSYQGLYEVRGPSDRDLGAKLFIESLASDGIEFMKSYACRSESNIREHDGEIAAVETGMRTNTKGSLYQYLYFFPDDPFLNFWAGLIKQKEGDEIGARQRFEKAAEGSGGVVGVSEYLSLSRK